ncbi:MAG TPA: hypothetical protein PLI09_13220 [Candidatus Hydrogenedentes bacterium]|nr:hypothetical protein [Candidatus Hydrogenedentota bacterium]
MRSFRFRYVCLNIMYVLLIAITGMAANTSFGSVDMDFAAMDIAPFALPNTPANEVWFEEPRDIARVMVEFKTTVPKNLGVSYLHKTWPETFVEQHEENETVARFGWVHRDDWFNTEWQKAAVIVEPEGDRRVWISFEGISKEFEEEKDNDVTFRRTLGLRVDAEPDAIHKIAVYTASQTAQTTLRVELDTGKETNTTTLRLEGYNCLVDTITALKGLSVKEDTLQLDGPAPRSFLVTLQSMIPAHDYCNDDGLLTFFLDDDAFTISLSSLEKEGPIWFEDRGVYITQKDDLTAFQEYVDHNKDAKTIAQRVLERDEQTLAGAMKGQPRAHEVSYNLACAHARQRFWLEANGDLLLLKRNVTWVPGKDTDRFKSKENARIFFGLENWPAIARFPDPEPVLAYTIQARREGITVEQHSFAVPLMTPMCGGTWAGDDTMVAMVRLRFKNDGPETNSVHFPIQYSQDSGKVSHRLDSRNEFIVPKSPKDALVLKDSRVLSKFKKKGVMRWKFQTAMNISAEDRSVVLSQDLKPGESCEAVLKIPFVAINPFDEAEALDALDFDACHKDLTEYWRGIGKQGTQLTVPETPLAALYTSHLTHVLITDFLMPGGSGLINTSVGTSTYGNFTNESCMIVHELDQRGMHEEARKRIELWVKYQGSEPQPGNFTDYDGMYYGAGGFEQGSYNQHHGWALWVLCEHYLFTRDDAWFASVVDSAIKGADWVFRQRKTTMTSLPHSRGWEYGFLPAGSLEDVTDFYYWLSTNALTWRATDATAQALEAAKHPDAARVRQEADAYRADLIKGFETMRQRSPIMRLRDGRWIPNYPSRLYWRGREVGWIREVLEGSVYLLISGLYDANTKQGGWILDDFQDNRYMSPPFGYRIAEFEHEWYDRGGLSIQPNLLAGLLPYIDRDEIELYLWMFYNDWAACYRPEINAMVEHPMPVLGYSNQAHFKTSDESNAVSWLRYMLVYERGDFLHFGRAVPRAWFKQNRPFGALNAATHFGSAGIRYETNPDKKRVIATVTFEQKVAPGKMLVRFRLPEGDKIHKARVDGAPATIADADKGDVDITGKSGTIRIEVEY